MDSVPAISAAILAAGRSSRMGYPKALLEVNGKTFTEILIGKLGNAGISEIYLVLGSDNERINAALNTENIKTIINSNWTNGQLSSLKAVLKALPSGIEAVMVCLVDHPGVRTETLRTLVREFTASAADITIPVYNGLGGHPVIFSKKTFDALLAAPEDQGARSVARSGNFCIHRVDVSDPFVRQDIDTPEEYSTIQNDS